MGSGINAVDLALPRRGFGIHTPEGSVGGSSPIDFGKFPEEPIYPRGGNFLTACPFGRSSNKSRIARFSKG